MEQKAEMARFREVVSILRSRFPQLKLVVEENDPNVTGNCDILKQPELDFDLNINLQNLDELHLCVSKFWVEWFPCGRQEVFDSFVSAVVGILSGEYRIVNYFVGRLHTSSDLQRFQDGRWEKVTGCANPAALIPWPREALVVQNTQGDLTGR